MLGLTYDNAAGHADVTFEDGQLVTEPGLITAILISLYTDKRDPSRPAGDQGGWWGTALDDPGDEWGSLLWTLARELPTERTRQKAEAYAGDALAWMVADGIAETVTVTAAWTQPQPGLARLMLAVDIKRPQSAAIERLGVWEAFSGS